MDDRISSLLAQALVRQTQDGSAGGADPQVQASLIADLLAGAGVGAPAAASSGGSGPGSSAAAGGGSRQQALADWMEREAANTLLAAAASEGPAGFGQRWQAGPQQQLAPQQLLGAAMPAPDQASLVAELLANITGGAPPQQPQQPPQQQQLGDSSFADLASQLVESFPGFGELLMGGGGGGRSTAQQQQQRQQQLQQLQQAATAPPSVSQQVLIDQLLANLSQQGVAADLQIQDKLEQEALALLARQEQQARMRQAQQLDPQELLRQQIEQHLEREEEAVTQQWAMLQAEKAQRRAAERQLQQQQQQQAAAAAAAAAKKQQAAAKKQQAAAKKQQQQQAVRPRVLFPAPSASQTSGGKPGSAQGQQPSSFRGAARRKGGVTSAKKVEPMTPAMAAAMAPPPEAMAALAAAGASRQQQQQQGAGPDAEGSAPPGPLSPDGAGTLAAFSPQGDEAAAAAVHAAATAAAAAAALSPSTGPASLRSQLGLPPVGLGGPLAAANVGALLRPALPLSHHLVLVWDLDDTLVPLHSLITGRFAAAARGVDAAHAAQLGRQLQALAMRLADGSMHFEALEDVDIGHGSDVWYRAAQHAARRSRRALLQRREPQQQEPPGNGAAAAADRPAADDDARPAKRARSSTQGSKPAGAAGPSGSDGGTSGGSGGEPAQLAPAAAAARGEQDAPAAGAAAARGGAPDLVLRPAKPGPPPEQLQQAWRDIQRLYDAGSGALPRGVADEADALYEQLDAACGGWLRAARRLLDALSASDELVVTHVIVGDSQLVPLLAKLLLTRLDGGVGLSQVFAAAAVPRLAAFRRVAARYGGRARYVVLGDGPEEEAAAASLGWPFVRVTLAPPAPQQQGEAAAGAPGGADDGGGDSGSERASSPGAEARAKPAAAARAQPALDALGCRGHALPDLKPGQLIQLALSLR